MARRPSKADTLFVIEPAPYQAQLQQAQATLAATQADLVQAEAEFTRQFTLGKSDFASQSKVDEARAKRDTDKAQIQNNQAGVTIAAINLGYTQVTAPFDGKVTAHQVSVGGLVGVTGPTKLATIVQLDPIYVTFTVSEQQVLRVKAAMAKRGIKPGDIKNVPVEVGLMTEDGYPHVGTLDYVAPMLDPSTGTLTARGILDNADRALLPGMFLRIRMPLAVEKANALSGARQGARRRPERQLPAGRGQGQCGAAANRADRATGREAARDRRPASPRTIWWWSAATRRRSPARRSRRR